MAMIAYQGLRVRRIDQVISTDDIIPGRYKHMFTSASDLVPHLFENLLPGFAATFDHGDVLCCSQTFGIGSSREQAVSTLLAAGVRAVVAPRFGRIFFRNAWNLGLPAIEVDTSSFLESECMDLDLVGGHAHCNLTTIVFPAPPRQMLEMVEQGGLLALLAKRYSRPIPLRG